MLLAAGAVYWMLGDPAEAAFLLSFVVAVIAISLVQQHRTQRALDSLRQLAAPRATVFRDGLRQRVASRDLVCGDLLVLEEGDRVAADAKLIEGELEVDESLLTGESLPVLKQVPIPADKRDTDVLAGTVVTRGVAKAIVSATGAKSAIGQLGASLNSQAEPLSPFQRHARRLVRRIGTGALLLAMGQIALTWYAGQSLLDSTLSGISLAMAILPEEIPVIVSVFFALGAWRIAGRQVLARRLSAIETLGAITVLAVDKTGTLTENRMQVVLLSTLERSRDLRVSNPAATTHFNVQPDSAFRDLVATAVLASRCNSFDPTERAIETLGSNGG